MGTLSRRTKKSFSFSCFSFSFFLRPVDSKMSVTKFLMARKEAEALQTSAISQRQLFPGWNDEQPTYLPTCAPYIGRARTQHGMHTQSTHTKGTFLRWKVVLTRQHTQSLSLFLTYKISLSHIYTHTPPYSVFHSRIVWPDWAIYCTLGNFSKPVATINLPNLPTYSGNFCKGVKIFRFSSEIIFGQLCRHFGIFYRSHCSRSIYLWHEHRRSLTQIEQTYF